VKVPDPTHLERLMHGLCSAALTWPTSADRDYSTGKEAFHRRLLHPNSLHQPYPGIRSAPFCLVNLVFADVSLAAGRDSDGSRPGAGCSIEMRVAV
jgi:hypothetical protein